MFNLRDRAKWDAWKAVEGTDILTQSIGIFSCLKLLTKSKKFTCLIQGKSKEEAMSDYITKVKQLLEEAGVSY